MSLELGAKHYGKIVTVETTMMNLLKKKLKNMWTKVVEYTWVLTVCFLLISAISLQ